MQSSSEQPLVGEERYVTTRITAAKETKEKLACQIFLDKENLSTIPHLHEQFFLVKENLSRKNCSCKWGFNERFSFN